MCMETWNDLIVPVREQQNTCDYHHWKTRLIFMKSGLGYIHMEQIQWLSECYLGWSLEIQVNKQKDIVQAQQALEIQIFEDPIVKICI